MTDRAAQFPDRRIDRATRVAWIGCALIGLLFLGSGVLSVVASGSGRAGPELVMACVGVLFGAVSIVGAVRVRRRDPAGVRFASIVMRVVLVIAGGNLVFGVVDGIGQDWGRVVWSLVATVCTAILLAAMEQLRTALLPPVRPR